MTDNPQRYHPRRIDRQMSPAGQMEVIRKQRFLTLAMCDGCEPYLANFNYAYSQAGRCFYVHSAPEGRKVGLLRANPKVWGQIIEDCGYEAAKCTHLYRSVQFEAVAEFVQDQAEVVRALEMMIDIQSPNPAQLKQKLADTPPSPASVIIIRLRVVGMSGKCNPAEK